MGFPVILVYLGVEDLGFRVYRRGRDIECTFAGVLFRVYRLGFRLVSSAVASVRDHGTLSGSV